MKIKSVNSRGKRTILKCLNCNEEFSEVIYKVNSGKGKFCCNECYQEYRKKHKLDEKEQNKLYQKKFKYNLLKEEYYKLFEEQNNKCLICNTTFDENNKAVVDHNHTTQKVRGLLCSRCNTLLGMAREDINILQSAIKYLEKDNGL